MKKFLLTVVVAVCSISYASAQQWTDYYVVEEVGQENASAYWFRIDWDGKYFFMDSDSEDEQMAPMKNYKESGNKRTFDVHYAASVGGDKYCSVEFITEGDGKFKLTQTHLNNWKIEFYNQRRHNLFHPFAHNILRECKELHDIDLDQVCLL